MIFETLHKLRTVITLSLFCVSLSAYAQSADRYNVVWETPGTQAADSMPMGNGSLGINLWAEASGDVYFYLSRNDSFSGVSQLCKVGRIRLELSPNPFTEGRAFKQELDLENGICRISAGEGENRFELLVFVDADAPVVHLLGNSSQPIQATAHVESWRTEDREVTRGAVRTLDKGPDPIIQRADTFPDMGQQSVAWYHRVEEAPAFEETVRIQSLESIRDVMWNPLLHNTFGGYLMADGFEARDERTYAMKRPMQAFHLRVASPGEQTESAQDWLALAEGISKEAADAETAIKRTRQWWQAFWERSWIHSDVQSTKNEMTIGKAHALQRYMQAGAGRSILPIKFNGSIFTVEPKVMNEIEDPDWRAWGDAYWWQNVRMPYHAMLAAGDYDLMRPLFDFYERLRPMAEARNKLYHGAEGAYYPETMTAWGTYTNRDYGWDREGKEPKDLLNKYVKHIWCQGPELVGLMLDYYEHTEDTVFLKEGLLPMATSIFKDFDTRFRKDADGQIVIDPTQALETYWFEVINDTPTVAGLHDMAHRLLDLRESLLTAEQHSFYQHMRTVLPEIPIEEVELKGERVERVSVAEAYNPRRKNRENPEVYVVWPFRLTGLGLPLLEEARNSYATRGSRNANGWGQDSMVAALLGLEKEASKGLVGRLGNSNPNYRWPASWGPNFDWIPDQCHGGTTLATMHYMLLQPIDGKLHLFPAWPKDWDVNFKLHAPGRTTVEATLKDGKLEALVVTPESRTGDIVLPKGMSVSL